MHPAATDPKTAAKSVDAVNWNDVADKLEKLPHLSKAPPRSKRVRTAEECRLRWVHYEMPGVLRAEGWTRDEDLAILAAAGVLQERQWVKVAEKVAAVNSTEGIAAVERKRTPIACLKRYQSALNTEVVNGDRWTAKESAELRDAVEVCARHSRKGHGGNLKEGRGGGRGRGDDAGVVYERCRPYFS